VGGVRVGVGRDTSIGRRVVDFRKAREIIDIFVGGDEIVLVCETGNFSRCVGIGEFLDVGDTSVRVGDLREIGVCLAGRRSAGVTVGIRIVCGINARIGHGEALAGFVESVCGDSVGA